MKIPTIAIIGRPNVGKSTLFQPHHRPAPRDRRRGARRDARSALCVRGMERPPLLAGGHGGMVPGATDPLNRAIRGQVEQAIAESDVLVFLVDIDAGVHPMDLEIAQYLRHAKRPVLLVVNKADLLPDETRQLSFYELGLGDPFPVSAAVGKNSGDLLDKLVSLLPGGGESEDDETTIRVAVVGRPNVGKSSIVNRLLGQDRHVVAPSPVRRAMRSTRRSSTKGTNSFSSTRRACASAARRRKTSSSIPRCARVARWSAPMCACSSSTRRTACTCRT